MLSLLKNSKRHYKNYSKIRPFNAPEEHFYEMIMGEEIMKSCLKLNLFARMGSSIKSIKEARSSPEEIELFSNIV